MKLMKISLKLPDTDAWILSHPVSCAGPGSAEKKREELPGCSHPDSLPVFFAWLRAYSYPASGCFALAFMGDPARLFILSVCGALAGQPGRPRRSLPD